MVQFPIVMLLILIVVLLDSTFPLFAHWIVARGLAFATQMKVILVDKLTACVKGGTVMLGATT